MMTGRHRSTRPWLAAAILMMLRPGGGLDDSHGAGGAGGAGAPSDPLPEMPHRGDPVAWPDDPHRRFDFWAGEWDVRNLHRRRGAWQESGAAVALVQPVVDGGAILEQWNGALGGNPLIGFSVRAYDPALDKWLVYLNWHGGRPGGFSLMHGSFDVDRLELFPPGGGAARYTFSLPHADSCQWDSARAGPDGAWTTDWVMQFTRRERPRPMDASNAPIRRPPPAAAAFEETRRLDFLIGAWSGRATGSGAAERHGTAVARVTSMIEGFGLLQLIDFSWNEKVFAALGHDRREQAWVALSADNRSTGIRRLVGEIADGRVTFTGESAQGQVVERWTCADADHCVWERIVRRDGATVATLRAELERVERSEEAEKRPPDPG